MDRKLLDILVCPATRQPLSLLDARRAGRPQPRHRRRRREARRRQPAGGAAARRAGDPRPQDRLPHRRRHPGAAGRRGAWPPRRCRTSPPHEHAALAFRRQRRWSPPTWRARWPRTSAPATSPPRCCPTAADSAYLLCKEDGVVARASVVRRLPPRARSRRAHRLARATKAIASPAGTVLATLRRPQPRAGQRRARLAEFPADPVGTATITAALRRRGARHRRARSSTPARPCPACALAQKYAVRVGGGSNHRIGLFDAVMLKENHIRAAGSIAAAIARARAAAPGAAADRRSGNAGRTARSPGDGLRPHPDRRLRRRDAARGGAHRRVRLTTAASRWKSPAASTWPACAASPRTASTASRSAR